MIREDDPTVFSTGPGGVSSKKPARRGEDKAKPAAKAADGIVRVRRETAGRGGRTVTTIAGVPGSEEALRDLAGTLKRLCGSGGTIKERLIEIQGDHRDRIVAHLESKGHQVKRAGG